MKCFHYFKDRTTRSREQRSAPILNYHNKSDVSEEEQQRVTKSSSCSATSPQRILKLYEEKSQNLRVFQFSELKQATNGFSRQLKIGEGGFGCVYKGSIKPVGGKGESTVVAIKMLNRDSFQGHKQWVAEVQFLGIVEHPNLVKLIGYCGVDGERGIQRLLVYEFMSNKSLEDHLFNIAFPTLAWNTRLEIAIGAAQGLAYLHEELDIQVIYRDFKSSNVLLDEDFKPKLSDFGLAREGPTAGQTHVSTAVMGTFGYAAPDYIETGHLTSKSDVWSFGVVLYEILTGRRSLERNRPKPEQRLLEWVRHYPPDSKKFGMLMDHRLESKYSLTAAKRTAKLAETCLSRNSKDRPKMSEVVESLRQILEVSEVESPTRDRPMGCKNETVESENKVNQMRASESAKKRIAHLAKLSEHVGGVSMRRFMIMQRGKVPVP